MSAHRGGIGGTPPTCGADANCVSRRSARTASDRAQARSETQSESDRSAERDAGYRDEGARSAKRGAEVPSDRAERERGRERRRRSREGEAEANEESGAVDGAPSAREVSRQASTFLGGSRGKPSGVWRIFAVYLRWKIPNREAKPKRAKERAETRRRGDIGSTRATPKPINRAWALIGRNVIMVEVVHIAPQLFCLHNTFDRQ